MRYVQDLPPKGGYPKIHYERVLAKTYFSGKTLLLMYFGLTAVSSVAFYGISYKIHCDNLENLGGEIAMYPMLLAEKDRMYLRQLNRNREAEESLMKDVEGWETGTYYGKKIYKTSDKLVEPTLGDYYVHNSNGDRKLRANISLWC